MPVDFPDYARDLRLTFTGEFEAGRTHMVPRTLEIAKLDFTRDYWVMGPSYSFFCFPRMVPTGGSAKFLYLAIAATYHTLAGSIRRRYWNPPVSVSYSLGNLIYAGSLYYSSGGVGLLSIRYLVDHEFMDDPEQVLWYFELEDGCTPIGVFCIQHDTYKNKALFSQGAAIITPSPPSAAGATIDNVLGGGAAGFEVVDTTPLEVYKVDLKSVYDLVLVALAAFVYPNYNIAIFEYSTDDVSYTTIDSTTATGNWIPRAENIRARYFRIRVAGDGTNATRIYPKKLFAWA